jgi:hypothetical protein
MGEIETTVTVCDYRNDPDAKDLAGEEAAHQVLLEIHIHNHHNDQQLTGLLWLGELAAVLREYGLEIKESQTNA